MFHVVLVEPEIPPNTGNIARLCLATGSVLHLVEPLGFSIDDRSLKRAGLDYWADVDVRVWPCLTTLFAAIGQPRQFFLTTKAIRPYWDQTYQPGDYLFFGRETRGLPESLLQAHPDQCLTIPMLAQTTRSLNLATAVGIVLYEAIRQANVNAG
jgi:tRNA (cytidine/uridine-2'-O-)-methyltransferase